MPGQENFRMAANLVPGGAMFRAWAPAARAIFVRGDFNGWSNPPSGMTPDGHGYWRQFVPGVLEGSQYKFYVVGQGSSGYKRDPYARALTLRPAYPACNCVITRPESFPWHDQDYRPPAFNDLVVYQFHFGVYYATDAAGRDQRINNNTDRQPRIARRPTCRTHDRGMPAAGRAWRPDC